MKLGFNAFSMTLKGWLTLSGSFLVLSGLGYYYFRKPRAKTLFLEILPKETLINLFSLIRHQYSKYYKKNQLHARKQRRKYDRASDEYFKYVKECFGIQNKLLDDAVNEVLRSENIKRDTYENSIRLLSHEVSVSEAYQEIRQVMYNRRVPVDLTSDKLHDILSFYWHRLEEESKSQGPYHSPLTLTLIEDDIYTEFKVEIEDIEKAFFNYRINLREFEPFMQNILQIKLLNEVEDMNIIGENI